MHQKIIINFKEQLESLEQQGLYASTKFLKWS